jgi:prepilin-type N-terminal cleavage/methylation domain-containing protein
MIQARKNQEGFTLAELLVASTIMAIVMTAVYTSFSTATIAWRVGSTDYVPYQDARTALTIMTRELQSTVTGTQHLFIGGAEAVECVIIGPSMNVEEREEPQIMWVKYELRRGTGDSGKTLVRREAPVKGALPIQPPPVEEDRRRQRPAPTVGLEKGQQETFELAGNVNAFNITYWWIPPLDDRALLEGSVIDYHREPVTLKENREGWGQPQGLKVTLTMDRDNEEKEPFTFTTFIAFRGATTEAGSAASTIPPRYFI